MGKIWTLISLIALIPSAYANKDYSVLKKDAAFKKYAEKLQKTRKQSEDTIIKSFKEDALYHPYLAKTVLENMSLLSSSTERYFKKYSSQINKTSTVPYGVSTKKRFTYLVSRKYNSYWYGDDKFFHSIIPGQLFLGQIPVYDSLHHGPIQKAGIKSILAVVEPFEIFTGGDTWASNVLPSDWKSLNINFHHVPSQDFSGMNKAQVAAGVEYLEQQIDKGNPTYVHCKAGRSRSSAVIIAYLVKHKKEYEKFYSPYYNQISDESPLKKEVLAARLFLRNIRKQVKVGDNKITTIMAYLKDHR